MQLVIYHFVQVDGVMIWKTYIIMILCHNYIYIMHIEREGEGEREREQRNY